ncbi:MAG TPA: hypothetical protein VL966_03335 [Alphaproteobacteria bacterium]|jgi:hypothetical protein|nr:hypothetical protein [Alphaproteobacteria bacterium]
MSFSTVPLGPFVNIRIFCNNYCASDIVLTTVASAVSPGPIDQNETGKMKRLTMRSGVHVFHRCGRSLWATCAESVPALRINASVDASDRGARVGREGSGT